MSKKIEVFGAKTHNLKNIDVKINRDQLVVITGLSGSGKSTLAFDTLYAEGQRRYVESLSAYARQFLSLMEKPDVDHIDGLSPAISIEQKTTSHNPRSTVGTITEIHDYLRLLFARIGTPHCPTHHTPLKSQTVSQMVDQILTWPQDTKIMITAPVVTHRKGEHRQRLEDLYRKGFIRALVNGKMHDLADPIELDPKKKHDINVVIDRLKVKREHKGRLAESLETALSLTEGLAQAIPIDNGPEPLLFSANYACMQCGFSLSQLSPRLFSFNSPLGACSQCDGLGSILIFDPERLVQNPQLSLAQGAIIGWNKNHLYYYQILESLAQHFKFSLDTPYNVLPQNIIEILFYGSGDTKIPLRYLVNGQLIENIKPFEGIIANLKRKSQQANSNIILEELARYQVPTPCPACHGARLNQSACHVTVGDKNMGDINAMSIDLCQQFFKNLELTGNALEIGEKILKEIDNRLSFLINVGLNYLSLGRSANTLSGGENQRIRLASQIGAGLVGVMYVLDEPSIGLHQRDNQRLLDTLKNLRDLGNSIIVVEHDEEAILQADQVIDMGPGAGIHGGEVIFNGTPKSLISCQKSITGQYLSGHKAITASAKRLPFNHKQVITLKGASANNLQNVSVDIPVGLFTTVTGVSGSGKSSLINTTLYPAICQSLGLTFQRQAGAYESLSGAEHIDKMIDINQSPIGRTPRSNPATYTGLMTPIRELFAQTEQARAKGYGIGRFSFNVKGGRCEACQGDGVIKVEMHFLADVYITCDQCQGKRYNRETLEVEYKGKNISDILSMTVEKAALFFDAIPQIKRKLLTLQEVGLSYIELGQRSTTLSGGEAQRIKLAKELSRRDTGQTLYILDEPTTGLHFADIQNLVDVLFKLRDKGNTLVVIEHNLDVIKCSDHIIDLGPEGGCGGGHIIATGTPKQIKEVTTSQTGQYL